MELWTPHDGRIIGPRRFLATPASCCCGGGTGPGDPPAPPCCGDDLLQFFRGTGAKVVTTASYTLDLTYTGCAVSTPNVGGVVGGMVGQNPQSCLDGGSSVRAGMYDAGSSQLLSYSESFSFENDIAPSPSALNNCGLDFAAQTEDTYPNYEVAFNATAPAVSIAGLAITNTVGEWRITSSTASHLINSVLDPGDPYPLQVALSFGLYYRQPEGRSLCTDLPYDTPEGFETGFSILGGIRPDRKIYATATGTDLSIIDCGTPQSPSRFVNTPVVPTGTVSLNWPTFTVSASGSASKTVTINGLASVCDDPGVNINTTNVTAFEFDASVSVSWTASITSTFVDTYTCDPSASWRTQSKAVTGI